LPEEEEEKEGDQESPQIYFESWPVKFHEEAQIDITVSISELKPSLELKKLQRTKSEHKGALSWSYEVDRSGP
jgi:hypothetical protein